MRKPWRIERCARALLAILAGAHARDRPRRSDAQGGPKDIRIRYAAYDEEQVFGIETDLRHSTTIHFGQGERFQAVIVGDTESFQVDPIPELGNVLTIKPHVENAAHQHDGDHQPAHLFLPSS